MRLKSCCICCPTGRLTMPERYAGYAASRLMEAGARYRRIAAQDYADNLGELAKIASLTWDAAMDILSALALLDGERLTGRSTWLYRYAERALPVETGLYWRYLARLHNFQHKPDHPEPAFRQACLYTGILLQLLNDRLPAALQLPATSRGWLALPLHQ